ncbi:hypothetical protein THAR02_03537 [Trichoderma harzianum]|uniref:Zn(2)-C6 fungal-type domain-containing protein n=1 Tax=Trichoderma harzianum TaxID=5544 RepID=A0A0G0AH63_TRIHA|nr:hypothetical protein THAR02_03537 [Trichoderma harzianum]
MPNIRQIKACSRCRLLKLRCDKTKPSCGRCIRAGTNCSLRFDNSAQTESASNPPATEGTATSNASVRSSSDQSPSPSDRSAPSSDTVTTEGDQGSKTVRRRQRAHLSCTRCHRLKVGCDKQLPCSRCRRSGWGRQCTYTHRIENDSSASASDATPDIGFVVSKEDPRDIYTSWHARRRGTTHWKALVLRIESSALKIGHLFHHAENIHLVHVDCATDILLPSNFPFNSPGAIKYSSLDKVRSLICTYRNNYMSFVDAYFALYQPVHPIIDPARFIDEINCFWNNPSDIDVSWLSSFLMVLALGCFAETRDATSTIELCLAAEACMAKTPFMVRPSMSVMRTMCLMVLAKQLANGSCWSFDASWTLLGIIVRLAVCIGLHRPPLATLVEENAMTQSDWQSSQILWITIVYFCIQTAAITGMPCLLSSDDILQRNEMQDAQLTHIEELGPWLSLSDSFPTICKIIARVNSSTEKPSYDEILRHNAEIRSLMATTLEHPGCRGPLRAVLDIFFRRILMVLHRCHALRPNAPTLHPVSYWASLECSLAILVHHRDFCEHMGNPDNRDLLGRMYKLDFFAAALTAGIHLLLVDAADAPLADGFSIPPKQTILETLETCTEIWGRDEERSICFRAGHRSLTQILSMLSDMDNTSSHELPH